MSVSSKTSGTKRTSIVPRYRMYRGKEIVLGPGKAELLEHIAETGSISEAARLMGMSYNRAWLHVKVMNESFKEPLVHSSRGGNEHGGAELTVTGETALKLYRKIEQEAAKATRAAAAALEKLVKG
jgi:molybdate transport system regulatory protein